MQMICRFFSLVLRICSSLQQILYGACLTVLNFSKKFFLVWCIRFRVCFGRFFVLSASVLRQIVRYLSHHTNGNASKTHSKPAHDEFKTVSLPRLILRIVFEDYKETICMSAFLFSLWFLLTSFNSKKTIKKICVVGRKTVLLLTLCRCCAILRINDDRTEDPSKISRRSPTAFCQERSGCYDNERYCRGFKKGTPYAVYLF